MTSEPGLMLTSLFSWGSGAIFFVFVTQLEPVRGFSWSVANKDWWLSAYLSSKGGERSRPSYYF